MRSDPSWRRGAGRWVLYLTLAMLAVSPAGGQDKLTDHPGFFDFAAWVGEEQNEVAISIKGPMIRLLAGTTRESDPDLSALLANLEAIEVGVYRVDEDQRSEWQRKIDRAASNLGRQGWVEAMTIRVERDYGHVFLKLDGDRTIGLAAMYISENNETFFVNIVGEIDLARIGHLASRYNLDFLSTSQLSISADRDSGGDPPAEAEPDG